jgi:LPS sulfotransferase NodH
MDRSTQARRFMVLASARTGSNLLLSLLSAHPGIKTYGELFNLDTLRRTDLLEALNDPVLYLGKKVYADHRPEIAAVGFKMFYDHLTDDYFRKLIDPAETSDRLREKFVQFSAFIEANYDWPTLQKRFRDAWDFLGADRRLLIVHLRRRNMLETLVSHKTALMTAQWWSLKNDGQPKTTLRLDPDECRRYFQKLDAFAADADAAFGRHRKIDVFYEDLVAAPPQVLAQVFAFLGIPDQPVSTIMKKQITAPTSEVVVNYRQLKEWFRDTKWNAFFE